MKTPKEIAEEFFKWQEESQPLKRFWELANETIRSNQENAENYPYNFWKSISIDKLAKLIEENRNEETVTKL